MKINIPQTTIRTTPKSVIVEGPWGYDVFGVFLDATVAPGRRDVIPGFLVKSIVAWGPLRFYRIRARRISVLVDLAEADRNLRYVP